MTRGTVVALLLAVAVRGHAADAPRNTTSGLAIGAGLGYQVTVLGAQALYYQALGGGFWLVPYAGGGVFPAEGKVVAGPAGGIMGSWGRAHRVVVDLSVGIGVVEVQKSVLTDNVIATRSLYGLSLGAGYEYVADGGFWVRPTLGATYLLAEPAGDQSRWLPTLNVTLGYKIW